MGIKSQGDPTKRDSGSDVGWGIRDQDKGGKNHGCTGGLDPVEEIVVQVDSSENHVDLPKTEEPVDESEPSPSPGIPFPESKGCVDSQFLRTL